MHLVFDLGWSGSFWVIMFGLGYGWVAREKRIGFTSVLSLQELERASVSSVDTNGCQNSHELSFETCRELYVASVVTYHSRYRITNKQAISRKVYLVNVA